MRHAGPLSWAEWMSESFHQASVLGGGNLGLITRSLRANMTVELNNNSVFQLSVPVLIIFVYTLNHPQT
jgi:hypothetical protein